MKYLYFLAPLFFITSSRFVVAQGFMLQSKYKSLVDLLAGVVDVIVLIAFPIIILMIIYSAFSLIAAQGNEGRLTTARNTMLWTIVGAVIVLAARPILVALATALESVIVI